MNNIRCKDCSNYIHEWCETKIDSPDPELVRDCSAFKQKTNFDNIITMNIDQLASYLIDVGWDCCNCSETERLDDNPLLRGERCDMQCELHCKNWLNLKAGEWRVS